MKEFVLFVSLLIAYIVGALFLRTGGTILDSSQDDFQDNGLYYVEKIVDGDTIYVSDGTNQHKIRLIGVDTPETSDPRKEVECYGQEATEFVRREILDEYVYLQTDESQGDVDRYDRWLRYVILQDGSNFNQKIIESGYGFEYTYDKPYLYQTEFKRAQSEARRLQEGLWAPDACENF